MAPQPLSGLKNLTVPCATTAGSRVSRTACKWFPDAGYPANDTRLQLDPPSLVIHRAPPVASATPCWSVSNPTSENPPDGPARATVQGPPEETRTLPFHEKRSAVIAVTPLDQTAGAVMAVQLDPPSVETYARSYSADWPWTSQMS